MSPLIIQQKALIRAIRLFRFHIKSALLQKSQKHINTHASLHLHYTNYIQFKCRKGAGWMKIILKYIPGVIFLKEYLSFFLRRKCQDVTLSCCMAILDSLINWMINTSKAAFLHCLQIIIIIITFPLYIYIYIYNILFHYMDGLIRREISPKIIFGILWFYIYRCWSYS